MLSVKHCDDDSEESAYLRHSNSLVWFCRIMARLTGASLRTRVPCSQWFCVVIISVEKYYCACHIYVTQLDNGCQGVDH